MVKGLYLTQKQVDWIDILTSRRRDDVGEHYRVDIWNDGINLIGVAVEDYLTDFNMRFYMDETDYNSRYWKIILTDRLNAAFAILSEKRMRELDKVFI